VGDEEMKEVKKSQNPADENAGNSREQFKL